jgi:hypothetical protein
MKKHPFYVELNDPILSTSELQELIKKLEPDAQRWKDLDLWRRLSDNLSVIMLALWILSVLAYIPLVKAFNWNGETAGSLIWISFGLAIIFFGIAWKLDKVLDEFDCDMDKLESIEGNDKLCESFLKLTKENDDEVIATFIDKIKSAGRYPTKAEYNCLVRYSENKNVHELRKVLNLSQAKL